MTGRTKTKGQKQSGEVPDWAGSRGRDEKESTKWRRSEGSIVGNSAEQGGKTLEGKGVGLRDDNGGPGERLRRNNTLT